MSLTLLQPAIAANKHGRTMCEQMRRVLNTGFILVPRKY
jgi:hypothetical protein